MLKRIGTHRIFCGDLARGAVVALSDGGKADVFYSEPPATARDVKVWRTSKQPASSSWQGFVAALADMAAGYSAGGAAIECSDDSLKDWVGAMERRGYRTLNVLPVFAKKPRLLWYGSRDPAAKPLQAPGVDEEPATAILSHITRPGQVVLDPCVGKGATARAVLRLGLSLWAGDINAGAVAATRLILQRGSEG